MKIVTENERETQGLGERLGAALKPGDLIYLTGDLGAGKTVLTKGIGRALGIEDYITSPTYTIINEYKGSIPLYHFDVFRLENIEEMHDVGFEEYIYGMGVVVIEWAEIINEILPREAIYVSIENRGNDKRYIEIKTVGDKYSHIEKELKTN